MASTTETSKSSVKSPTARTPTEKEQLPQLGIGVDVSAKYRGAWCEGKVIKRQDITNCKVVFDNGLGNAVVKDVDVKGTIAINESVLALEPHSAKFMKAVIQRITNGSLYTVRFHDGDERTVPRNKVTLMGPGHSYSDGGLTMGSLATKETADSFGSPTTSEDGSSRKRRRVSDVGAQSEDQDGSPQPTLQSSTDVPENVGDATVPDGLSHQAVLVNPCRDGTDDGRFWWPALIVPAAEVMRDMIGAEDVDPKVCFVVRFFEDHLYAIIEHKHARLMQRYTNPFERFCKMHNGRFLKLKATQKSLLYLDHGHLPSNFKWKTYSSKCDKEAAAAAAWEKQHNVGGSTSGNRWNPNPIVERTFRLSLTEYMTDMGTPIKRTPSVGFKDLDLFKLYTLVQKEGGFLKVNEGAKWRSVYGKLLNLDDQVVPSTGEKTIRTQYEKYLAGFEKFMNPSKISPVDEKLFDKKQQMSMRANANADKGNSVDGSPNKSDDMDMSETPSPTKNHHIKRGRATMDDDDDNDDDGGDDDDDADADDSDGRAKRVFQQGKDPSAFEYEVGKLARCTYKDGKRYVVLIEARRMLNADGTVVAKDAEGGEPQYKVHFQNWAKKYDQWVDTSKLCDVSAGGSRKRHKTQRATIESVANELSENSRRKIKKEKREETTTTITTTTSTSPKMSDEELARALQLEEAANASRRRETRRSWNASLTVPLIQKHQTPSSQAKARSQTVSDNDYSTFANPAQLVGQCYTSTCLSQNKNKKSGGSNTSEGCFSVSCRATIASARKKKTTVPQLKVEPKAIITKSPSNKISPAPPYSPKFVDTLVTLSNTPITTQLDFLRTEFTKHSLLAKNLTAKTPEPKKATTTTTTTTTATAPITTTGTTKKK